MLFTVICDAIVASIASFVIINLIAFSFNCIFFSKKKFSLDDFLQELRNINREEK